MARCEDCETPVVWLRKPDGLAQCGEIFNLEAE